MHFNYRFANEDDEERGKYYYQNNGHYLFASVSYDIGYAITLNNEGDSIKSFKAFFCYLRSEDDSSHDGRVKEISFIYNGEEYSVRIESLNWNSRLLRGVFNIDITDDGRLSISRRMTATNSTINQAWHNPEEYCYQD